jgi:hypothetical protein
MLRVPTICRVQITLLVASYQATKNPVCLLFNRYKSAESPNPQVSSYDYFA